MKQFLLVISFFIYCNGFTQSIDTSDIFEVGKNHRLILKPALEKRIDSVITPVVMNKMKNFDRMIYYADLQFLSERQKQDEYDFIKDTIYINEFLIEYEDSYSMATTTMGMNWGNSKRLDAYDKLLNKYYQKALLVLKPGMKEKLKVSQKRWLEYYNKESDFIYEMNDFGNHNSSLYNWAYYFKMLEARVLFLKDVCNEAFHGIDTYKE